MLCKWTFIFMTFDVVQNRIRKLKCIYCIYINCIGFYYIYNKLRGHLRTVKSHCLGFWLKVLPFRIFATQISAFVNNRLFFLSFHSFGTYLLWVADFSLTPKFLSRPDLVPPSPPSPSHLLHRHRHRYHPTKID